MLKSLKEISWDVPESVYRKDSALSYSTLAKYERNGRFHSLPTLFERISTPSLTFGSIVDVLITGTKEEFDQTFYVADIPEISDSLKEIALLLYNRFKEQHLYFKDISDTALSQAGLDCNFYVNTKYANYRIKLIKESCEDYYNILLLSNNKTVITSNEYQDALAAVNVLKESKATAFYFNTLPFEDNIEKLYQLKFKGIDTQTNVEYRIMADEIIINHDNKTIQPIDLKTSSHYEDEFPKSFIQWRYDIQAALYYYIIRQNCLKDEYFKDFEILPYKFIVVNRRTLQPCVWSFPITAEHMFFDCTIHKKTGNIVLRNVSDIGKELRYYLDNPNVKLPLEIKEDNDIIKYLENEI